MIVREWTLLYHTSVALLEVALLEALWEKTKSEIRIRRKQKAKDNIDSFVAYEEL